MTVMRSFEGMPMKMGPKLSWSRLVGKKLVVWWRTEKERQCGREVVAREGG